MKRRARFRRNIVALAVGSNPGQSDHGDLVAGRVVPRAGVPVAVVVQASEVGLNNFARVRGP